MRYKYQHFAATGEAELIKKLNEAGAVGWRLVWAHRNLGDWVVLVERELTDNETREPAKDEGETTRSVGRVFSGPQHGPYGGR